MLPTMGSVDCLQMGKTKIIEWRADAQHRQIMRKAKENTVTTCVVREDGTVVIGRAVIWLDVIVIYALLDSCGP